MSLLIDIAFWSGVYITKGIFIGIYNTGKYIFGIKSEKEIISERLKNIEYNLEMLSKSNLKNKELCNQISNE